MPPKIKAKATGTVAFLGDDILSAKNVAPTLLVNYHFGSAGDTWRPYLGAGINYTKFTDVEVQAGAGREDERLDRAGGAGRRRLRLRQGLGPVRQHRARRHASPSWSPSARTVLTTEIDFRPVTYSFGPVVPLLVHRADPDGGGAQALPPRPSTIFIARMRRASASVTALATTIGQAPSITP